MLIWILLRVAKHLFTYRRSPTRAGTDFFEKFLEVSSTAFDPSILGMVLLAGAWLLAGLAVMYIEHRAAAWPARTSDDNDSS